VRSALLRNSLRLGVAPFLTTLGCVMAILAGLPFWLRRGCDRLLRLERELRRTSIDQLARQRRWLEGEAERPAGVGSREQGRLSSELDLSSPQGRLITSLMQRLEATVNVNVSFAPMRREPLPMPKDPTIPVPTPLQWPP
jgi:hypothetical protein